MAAKLALGNDSSLESLMPKSWRGFLPVSRATEKQGHLKEVGAKAAAFVKELGFSPNTYSSQFLFISVHSSQSSFM